MKNIIIISITLLFIVFSNNVEAQKRTKTRKGKQGQKTVAHKGKNGKKTVIHKGKAGNTTIVRKGKHGNVKTQRTYRKPIKRKSVAHYHYRHLPKRGAIVTSLPKNTIIIKHGGYGFRFHSGVWYKASGTKWIVTKPLYGIRIKVLPVGYKKLIIGPKHYYYYYGTYYEQKNDEYEVIEAPLGSEIESLPEGYNIVPVGSLNYYELDGVYYMPSLDDEGNEILVVVENPTK